METLRALLTGIIDYAGLFPPAKLDMPSTVRNFARHYGSANLWILGHFVLPAARFEEFEQAAAALLPADDDEESSDLWLVSALLSPAGSPDLEREIEQVLDFNDRHVAPGAGAAFVDALEIRASGPDAIESAMRLMPVGLFPYFELPADGDLRGTIAALAGEEVGAKVRTGGLTADAIPSIERLAEFVALCAAAGVPFKATAGLHHPLRHRARDPDAWMHGFLNLFGAACVAWHARADTAEIARILAEESPAAFRFGDDVAEICGHRLTAEQIAEVRERFAHSFGSCSIEEPLDDLEQLALIGKARSA